MKEFMRKTMLLAIAALLGTAFGVQAESLSGSRPNIILFLTDDNGWGEMGAAGNPILKTPVIDRFYRDGLRFTNYHVAPNCAPTRCQLMTGKHNFRSGVTGTTRPYSMMSLKSVTVAQEMKKAGYSTGHVGKWHLGNEQPFLPHNRGFDTSISGGLTGGPDGEAFDGTFTRNGIKIPFQGYRTDALFDQAMGWIREVKGEEKPFFLYLATYNPHAPFEVPEKWREPYKNKGLIDKGRRKKDGSSLSGEGFYAEIANLDWNFGRLLEFIDAEGLSENTLIMYMTDNGHALSGCGQAGHNNDGTSSPDALYNMGLRGGKGQSWRGGTCVPWITRGPGRLEAGAAADTLTGSIDFLPTMVDLAGGSVEHSIDGISLVPLMEDPGIKLPGRAIFTNKGLGDVVDDEVHERSRYIKCAVQTEHYRWVHGEEGSKDGFELYDHRTDPGEKNNIAAQHPELMAEMKRKYDAWYDEMIPTIYNETTRDWLASGKLADKLADKKKRKSK